MSLGATSWFPATAAPWRGADGAAPARAAGEETGRGLPDRLQVSAF